MLAVWVSFLDRLGSLGEPQGGAMAAQGPSGGGGMHATGRDERGGVPERTTENLLGSTLHSCTPHRAPSGRLPPPSRMISPLRPPPSLSRESAAFRMASPLAAMIAPCAMKIELPSSGRRT